MNPGDPQLRECIEGVRREPSGIPDQADPDVFNPPSPGSRPPSVASSYGSIDSGVSHPPRAGNKQKKRVDITWDDFDDSDQDGDKSKTRTRARKEEPDAKKFACPFYKRYPKEPQESLECVAPGLTSAHLVNDHIFRRHVYSKLQCHRCYDEFSTETALHGHQRADNPCEKKPVTTKIDVQQEQQLRDQDMYGRYFENEWRWNATYKIIFPDAKVIPSPYFEPLNLHSYYRTLLMNHLPALAKRELNNDMDNPLHPGILHRVEDAVITALKGCFSVMDEVLGERANRRRTKENQLPRLNHSR
ncbi:uncharacterized protein NECHADRAFT_85352 [Fusarium vanettenii 77-13-4]|uniref:C2H2-type domain-containing protein n=1 Tax=Fusarium vanettenii (strain ATCC MYA-4622 / CBS 123669 / FGSC 9596 / NRRL 45880 / 77-13-4) TaxID=660122 RepID=C7ZJ41_FUSV7|nr:uncharacterized protein NECHADRAFT_85352 [Fusarium vanettenii 77-13-4]EEU36010.1 hypothetical protein NECHADRAFT_85352 [Fusarium vanettenii 77-13-4]